MVRAQLSDGTMEHFEGEAGAERKVRTVCTNGEVLHFDGEAGAERKVGMVRANGELNVYEGAREHEELRLTAQLVPPAGCHGAGTDPNYWRWIYVKGEWLRVFEIHRKGVELVFRAINMVQSSDFSAANALGALVERVGGVKEFKSGRMDAENPSNYAVYLVTSAEKNKKLFLSGVHAFDMRTCRPDGKYWDFNRREDSKWARRLIR